MDTPSEGVDTKRGEDLGIFLYISSEPHTGVPRGGLTETRGPRPNTTGKGDRPKTGQTPWNSSDLGPRRSSRPGRSEVLETSGTHPDHDRNNHNEDDLITTGDRRHGRCRPVTTVNGTRHPRPQIRAPFEGSGPDTRSTGTPDGTVCVFPVYVITRKSPVHLCGEYKSVHICRVGVFTTRGRLSACVGVYICSMSTSVTHL